MSNDLKNARILFDLSIPLRFNGPQPNAYGVEPASSADCEYGELVGDTRRGGSCNFERYTFIPHCNGTHTECIGHITNERISVRDCLQGVIVPALLVSVAPEPASGVGVAGDRVITAELLQNALPAFTHADSASKALVVRTLPNDSGKLTAVYNDSNVPPYFSADAMRLIVEHGFTHLLCDLPSIDRIFDEGKLLNHRIFWGVEQGRFEAGAAARRGSTVTELIYVPNDAADGEYMLNLQIAPFASDAAPSRPILLLP